MLDQGSRGLCPRVKTEAVMNKMLRGFLVSVLFSSMVLFPGMAVAQDENDVATGPACGMEVDEADQVAAVRAMADGQCDCNTAATHGAYVSCVDQVTDAAISAGMLRPECEDAVVSCADNSTCGKPGFVTCCRTNRNGAPSCSIKQNAAQCKAQLGGTACVGSFSSCCDAC